jgi:flagellar hook-associated protein 1 FlgK
VAGSLDAFFGTISQWSLTPNDAYARQRVLEGAGRLVDSFHFIVKTVNGSQADSKTEVTGIVDRINRLGETVQSYNREVRGDARKLYDPGLDAQLHAALEELSEYVDFDVVKGNEGSIQVLIGGQTHLTIGDNFYPVSADFSSAGIVIRDAAGKDVTAQIQQGKLRGSLDFHNGLAPGLVADLDTLAIAVADRVNAVLAGGLDLANQPGAELFTYDAAGGAAATIRVNNITPAQLAAALPGAPGGNGNALQLAALSTSKQINDVTFTEFYGGIAGKVGNLIGHSRQDERTHALLLAQARNIRAQETEVDLDEEASKLVAFQRQYEANAELFRVLNGLTETLINLIR